MFAHCGLATESLALHLHANLLDDLRIGQRGDVTDIALDLVKRTGCAFLMATHSTRLAAKLDRTVRLSAGLIS